MPISNREAVGKCCSVDRLGGDGTRSIDGGMRMRESPGAMPGPVSPEPSRTQCTSDAVPTDGMASGAAAARMEAVIDQFIWRDSDRDGRPEPDAAAPNAADAAHARHDGSDIVARLAPRPHDDPDRLPRIVTTSLPLRPPALPGDERWRRQFIGALHDADDDTSMAPGSSPLAPYARMTTAGSRRDQHDDADDHGYRHRRPPTDADASSPFAAGWSTTPRVLAAAVAMTCVFSTGVLWATHRSEIAVDARGQAAEVTIAIPTRKTDAGTAAGQPIRNTPVLIREGEVSTFGPDFAGASWRQGPALTPSSMAPKSASAPILPRIINGGEAAQPVVRVVPIEPITPPTQAAAAVAPGVSATGATDTTALSPSLDRDGLMERVARPAEVPDQVRTPMPGTEPPQREAVIGHEPAPHKRPAGAAPVGRVSSAPVQPHGPAPKVARGYVPVEGWEMRRQGLRSEPEPEPSMLKKLVGAVWPFGKSSTTVQPAKPIAPAVTTPAFSWTDNSRANP